MFAHGSQFRCFAGSHLPFVLNDWRAQKVDAAQGHQAYDHAEGNEPRLSLVADRRLQSRDNADEVQRLVGQ